MHNLIHATIQKLFNQNPYSLGHIGETIVQNKHQIGKFSFFQDSKQKKKRFRISYQFIFSFTSAVKHDIRVK